MLDIKEYLKQTRTVLLTQDAFDELVKKASAQPTDADIQRMQDIEQAMLEKAYECGKQDAVQWIPCSERLPEEDYWTGANASALMTVYNAEDEETIIDYGHTVDGKWYSETTDCLVPSWWEVLAWMPLPEPYRKEGGE